ncbi:hypothetical protein ABTC38_18115, partial [Acinetobacter baumannii]
QERRPATERAEPDRQALLRPGLQHAHGPRRSGPHGIARGELPLLTAALAPHESPIPPAGWGFPASRWVNRA